MKNRVLLMCVILFTTNQFACLDKTPVGETNSTSSVVSVSSPEEEKGRGLLANCLEAHGGLDQWQKFEGLEYTLINNGKPVYQLTHLRDRRAYIRSEDFEVGFDGKVAWAYPDANNISGNSPAFYYNLDFYFVGMPFVLADPGVRVAHQGSAEVDGKRFEVLQVTFGSDIGFTPDDIYLLYLDPESFRLEILVYSVSFFETNQSGLLKTAKVYSDYTEVQGLLMPGKMENFSYDEGVLGASKGHTRLFKDIQFLTTIPNEDVFSIKDGAVTEIVYK
ncbi:MAG: hypothetical protein HKN76_08545 [Saprospiraceae bacterium]|nr:hypothetical protein [Saprospiraceae bacterium]